MRTYGKTSFNKKIKFTILDKVLYQTPENKHSFVAANTTIIPIWARILIIIPLLIADYFFFSHHFKNLDQDGSIFVCIWCVFMGIMLLLLLFSATKRPAKKITVIPKNRTKSTLFDPAAKYIFQDNSSDYKRPVNSTSIRYLKEKLNQRQATVADLVTLRDALVSDPKGMFACLELQGVLPKDTEITQDNMWLYADYQVEEIVDAYLHFFQKHLSARDIIYAYSWLMISAQEALTLLKQAKIHLPLTEEMLERDDEDEDMDTIVETFEHEYNQRYGR